MTYNYLTLVNDVNKRVNEVELTPSSFSSATGFYSTAKDAVNYSLSEINQQQFEWPFNALEHTETLTAGDVKYFFPSDARRIDFDSFRIKRDSGFGNDTKHLRYVSYEEYIDRYVDHLYNTDVSIREIPKVVTQNLSNGYLLYPSPDKAYELVFDYFTLPSDLEAYDDVPTVPEQFRNVIVSGAMFYVHTFRGDLETASAEYNKFSNSINNMRTIYTNRTRDVRDTRILRPNLRIN